MPWELLGEEDPDVERRESERREQEELAHQMLGIPLCEQLDESPEQVLARFGLLNQGETYGG